MDTEQQQLEELGAELIALCQDEVRTTPVTRFGAVNTSGKLAASLRATVTPTATGYRLELSCLAYVLTLIYGRRPGRFPNLTGIKEWIADTGIVPRPDARGRPVSTDTLAFLIGRKIANEGNVVFQQGPPSALFGDALGKTQVLALLRARLVPLLLEDVRGVLQQAARPA